MKKLIALALLSALLLGSLVGCSNDSTTPQDSLSSDDVIHQPYDPNTPHDPNTPPDGVISVTKIPDGMTGDDVAKLLLASQRLDGQIISGGLFDDGVETFNHLASEAKKHASVTPLGTANKTNSVQNLNNVGKKYTEFPAFSRNYTEFGDTTDRIVSDAQMAADTIDFVKKHIRLLDVWVYEGEDDTWQYFLHVDENSETIITRMKDSSEYRICQRYKNAEGDDVYETMVVTSHGDANRATYIKGKRYEFSINITRDQRYQGITANYDKGYWEIVEFICDRTWPEGEQFSIELITMKEDICYSTMYDFRTGKPSAYSMTTPDKSCDIVTISVLEGGVPGETNTHMNFNLAAFEGYDYLIAEEHNMAKMYLKDGRVVELGTNVSADDGSYIASVNAVYASDSAWGSEGSVILQVVGAGEAQDCYGYAMDVLESWGLSCHYDMDVVYASFQRATLEMENAIKYTLWHGQHISSYQGLNDAIAVEIQKYTAMEEMYTQVKDVQTVSTGGEVYELLIQFAETSVTVENASYDNGILSLQNLSLTISDTLLMVDGSTYFVALAMQSAEDGSLVHLAMAEAGQTYSRSDSFTVTTNSMTLEIPVLEGEAYTLVAYIASLEGIRSTAAVAVPVAQVTGDAIKQGNTVMSATQTAEGHLQMTYTKNYDAYITLAPEQGVDYAAFYELVASATYQYGEPSAQRIEVVAEDGTATPMSGDESAVASGVYRLAYSVENGERSASGYVYVTFTAGTAEAE